MTDLEEGPPEKATRTLSVGESMALEVTAKRNLPKRLARKQSAQNWESPSAEKGGLVLHLRHRPLMLFLLLLVGVELALCSSGRSL